MPTAAKRASSKKAAPLPENRTQSEVVADALLARYNDLAPSLNRIMTAGLGEAGRLHAITAFQDSLGVTGDPMRDPANAIAAGRLHDHPADTPEPKPATTA
jgi:hypothetical protein